MISVRCSRLRCVLIGTLLSLTAAPAIAADTPLGVIPDSAGAVARFRQPKVTIDAVAKFASSVDAKRGAELRKMMSDYGMLISNKKSVGVDPKLDWFVAVFPMPAGLPGVVFAVPGTDLDAMEEAVKAESSEDLHFARHENWLFYSDNEQALGKLNEGIAGKGKAFETSVDADSKGILDRHDVTVWINVRMITHELYKDELGIAKEEIDKAVADIASLTPQQEGIDLKPVFEIYAKMAHAILQGLLDTRAVAIGLSVKPTGIEYESVATVEPGSPTAAFLARSKPSAMPLFDRLPHDRFLYMGTQGDLKAFDEFQLKIATAFVKDPAQAREIASALTEYAQLQIGTQVHAFGIGDMKTGLLRATSLMELESPDRMRNLMRRSPAVMEAVLTAVMSLLPGGVAALPLMEYRQDADLIGNVSVDVVAAKTPPAGNGNPATGGTAPAPGAPTGPAPIAGAPTDPAAAAGSSPPSGQPAIGGAVGRQAADRMMALLFGPSGVEARIAYLSDLVVMTQGGGKDAMADALKSAVGVKPKSGTGTVPPPKPNPATNLTRAQLSPEANFYFLIDVPTLMVELFKAWSDSKNPQAGAQPQPVRPGGRPAPPPPDPMKQLGIKPSYIGMSVAIEPTAVRTKLFVPLKQVQGLTKMDAVVTQFMMRGGLNDFGGGSRSGTTPQPPPGAAPGF